jgi:hypothetical protein
MGKTTEQGSCVKEKTEKKKRRKGTTAIISTKKDKMPRYFFLSRSISHQGYFSMDVQKKHKITGMYPE